MMEAVLAVFKASTRRSEFTDLMVKQLGFKAIGSVNKTLYFRDDLDYVIKMIINWDFMPQKKSKISKYYLYPFKTVRKQFRLRYTKLYFQKKADLSDQEAAFTELMAELKKERIFHKWDAGAKNVGRIDGKPVIIDY
jgi:hypothetical protein